jgi:hypothetical protein
LCKSKIGLRGQAASQNSACSLQVGGMTTGRIVGKGINGTTKQYHTGKSNKTGGAGKRINIGRSKIVGVFKV